MFKPRSPVARMLYDAFQEEAVKRSGRTPDEWQLAERHAVWMAARDYAQQHGLRVLTLAEVQQVEEHAAGSVDYGAKWAYGIVNKWL